jgi:hypothetical protein
LEHSEHHIVIGNEPIEIRIELLDPEEEEYTISSDSQTFIDIFTTNNFRLRKGDQGLDNQVLGNVIQRHQAQALEILAEVRKVL